MFYILGCYFGLVIDSKYYKGTHRNINQTQLKKTLIRLISSLLLIFPVFVCPAFFIKSMKYILLVLLFKYGMPGFFVGLMLFGFSKRAYERLSIVQEEDLSLDTSMS